jgi:pyridoxal phosphate enzyme (YggS family)
VDADGLRAALADARSRIEHACLRAGRDPAGVGILPVTKTVSAVRLRVALSLGLTTFGENRVQEADTKAAALPGASWQMVGHLQSNKTARAVDLFEAIQSVDSVELAERLARQATAAGRAPFPVYLQVNVDADPAKAGFAPRDLTGSIARLVSLGGLEVRGLMTVGRLVATAEEARPTFRALRELSEQVRATEARVGAGLSMGMSDDFEIAVEEGATLVRLGRVLFGERPRA